VAASAVECQSVTVESDLDTVEVRKFKSPRSIIKEEAFIVNRHEYGESLNNDLKLIGNILSAVSLNPARLQVFTVSALSSMVAATLATL
jgi:hypothetical protein